DRSLHSAAKIHPIGADLHGAIHGGRANMTRYTRQFNEIQLKIPTLAIVLALATACVGGADDTNSTEGAVEDKPFEWSNDENLMSDLQRLAELRAAPSGSREFVAAMREKLVAGAVQRIEATLQDSNDPQGIRHQARY